MKRIRIVCIGKLAKSFCREGSDEYLKRLKPFFDISIVEIPEQPTVKRESEELLKRAGSGFILMDINGEQLSSEDMAALVRSECERSDEICFVIGGASGFSEAVRGAAKRRISFGRVTYPHQIARLLLCEQLYRAATIIKGLPYHK